MLRSLGARASRPQTGAADPTQRLDFIFRCVFVFFIIPSRFRDSIDDPNIALKFFFARNMS